MLQVEQFKSTHPDMPFLHHLPYSLHAMKRDKKHNQKLVYHLAVWVWVHWFFHQWISIVLRCSLVICNDFIVLWPTEFFIFEQFFLLLSRSIESLAVFFRLWVDSLHSLYRRSIFSNIFAFNLLSNPFYSFPFVLLCSTVNWVDQWNV